MNSIDEMVDAIAEKQAEASKLRAQLGQSLLVTTIAPSLVFPVTRHVVGRVIGRMPYSKERAVRCYLEDVNGVKQYLTVAEYESFDNVLEADAKQWRVEHE